MTKITKLLTNNSSFYIRNKYLKINKKLLIKTGKTKNNNNNLQKCFYAFASYMKNVFF